MAAVIPDNVSKKLFSIKNEVENPNITNPIPKY